MNPTTVFYEFLARGDASGHLAGMHYQTRTVYTDDAGKVAFDHINDPQPVEAGSEQLSAILADLNASALMQVQELTAQLATAQAAIQAAEADATAKQARIDALQSQLDAATPSGEPTTGTDGLLGSLNEVFASIPAEYQAQFAGPYAIVRVLIQANQRSLAAAVVNGVAVPDALASIKAQILATLAT